MHGRSSGCNVDLLLALRERESNHSGKAWNSLADASGQMQCAPCTKSRQSGAGTSGGHSAELQKSSDRCWHHALQFFQARRPHRFWTRPCHETALCLEVARAKHVELDIAAAMTAECLLMAAAIHSRNFDVFRHKAERACLAGVKWKRQGHSSICCRQRLARVRQRVNGAHH